MGVGTERENLIQILDSAKVGEESACTADSYGNCGRMTVYPTTEEEISRIVKYANEKGKKIVVEGNGSKRGYGGQIEVYDICLSMRDYRGIADYESGDMTITVKAGTPFCEVQEFLKKQKQRISLDPYSYADGTVGGIIAANDSGPKRLSYGSARDSVIGMRVVYADGTFIRCGGKVVKNVAGYDMNKLFIGSMGTLAVITEITFKLKPMARYESVVCVTVPKTESEQLKRLAVQILDSMMEPVSLQCMSTSVTQALLDTDGLSLAIAFEDVKTSVNYEEQFVKRLLSKDAQMQILQEADAERFWEKLIRLSPVTKRGEAETDIVCSALKIGVKNTDIIQIISYCEGIVKESDAKIYAHGGFGHGLCEVYLHGTKDWVFAQILQLKSKVRELGGYCVIKHAPLEVRQRANVWSEQEETLFLMREIKKKCDPHAVLNEKRFVGGI